MTGRLIGMAALASLLLAGPAAARTTTLEGDIGCAPIENPNVSGACLATTVAAYGGWSAWSRPDQATGEFRLVVRRPGGAVVLAPVAERAAPFDVSLGPSGGGVAAVYSHCVDPVALTGCSLALLRLDVAGARERSLAVPGGGSVHTPAIWDRQVAFLRRDVAGGGELPALPGRDPDRLFEWTIGGAVRSLPFPHRDGAPGVVGALALRGTEVAFTTDPAGEVPILGLWTQRPGAVPREVDIQTSGQGDVCTSTFLSPTFTGTDTLVALLRGCQPGVGDRLTRYDLRTGGAQWAQVPLGSDENNDVTSAVPVGGAVEWINDADLLRQDGLRWRALRLTRLPQGCSPTSC
jgi:hypothetical protein